MTLDGNEDNFCLLETAWIPVRLRDGSRSWISPSALMRHDLVAFDADRADFNGALAQFSIALLQTVWAPSSRIDWAVRWRSPPDEQAWREALAPWRKYFEFDGAGPRFMQDFDLRANDGDPVPIANLLIETPGENTLKNHGDHFVKRNQVERMCTCCAALALLTLQINAPAGGAGHRTGLRGGGPLTTLLVPSDSQQTPRSLWHMLWLNVLPATEFAGSGDLEDDAEPHFMMPWLKSINVVQPEGGALAPTQVHPLQVLWSMPRRIRLDTASVTSGVCDLCRRPSDRLLSQYVTRNYGLNYKGAWRHPLTPYYETKDDKLPMHPQPGGLGWRHWLGLVLGQQSDKRRIEAAAVVSRFLSDTTLQRSGMSLRLWAFGFDMDNMKARCWYEATMPLYELAEVDQKARQRLQDDISAWLAGADLVVGYLRSAVKDAWFKVEARGDFSHVDAAFWSRTEVMFYRLLRDTLAGLRLDTPVDGHALKEAWRRHLQAVALQLFEDDLVGAGPIERQNLARVAEAHRQLRASLHGPKLRAALALPALVDPATGSPRTKSKAVPSSRKTAGRSKSQGEAP